MWIELCSRAAVAAELPRAPDSPWEQDAPRELGWRAARDLRAEPGLHCSTELCPETTERASDRDSRAQPGSWERLPDHWKNPAKSWKCPGRYQSAPNRRNRAADTSRCN